jgi:hypothetical protein
VHTANLVSGTEAYAYPVDFIKEQRLTAVGVKLNRQTIVSIDVLYPDRAVAPAASGNPIYYFHHDREFHLYPAPSVSTTNGLVVWYVRNAAQLTGSVQIPEIPTIFHEDLVEYCLYRALQQDEQWVPAREQKNNYEARLMNTIYDSNVKQSESYPSVQLCVGD